MARKPKAKTKAKHSRKSKVKTKAKAKPNALSAAQRKVFSATKSAVAAKLNMQNAARAYRGARLGAFSAAAAKYRAANRGRATASIAANAANQSMRQAVYSHQNASLVARIRADSGLHKKALGKATSIQKSSLKNVNRAAVQTVTFSQAMAHEKTLAAASARRSAAAKRAKAAKAKGKPKKTAAPARAKLSSKAKAAKAKAATAKAAKRTPAQRASAARQASVNARATAAGLAAAQSVKAPVKAAKGRAAPSPGSMPPRPQGTTWTPAPVSSAHRGYMWTHARIDSEDAGWFQQADGECVAVAIANSLLFATGHRMLQEELDLVTELLGRFPSMPLALDQVKYHKWDGWILHDYSPYLDKWHWLPGMLVGYEVPTGPHAALTLTRRRVVSWGEVMHCREAIEEAWMLDWELKSE